MGCKNCGRKRDLRKYATFSIRIPVKKTPGTNQSREIQTKLTIYAKELINES